MHVPTKVTDHCKTSCHVGLAHGSHDPPMFILTALICLKLSPKCTHRAGWGLLLETNFVLEKVGVRQLPTDKLLQAICGLGRAGQCPQASAAAELAIWVERSAQAS